MQTLGAVACARVRLCLSAMAVEAWYPEKIELTVQSAFIQSTGGEMATFTTCRNNPHARFRTSCYRMR